MEELVLVIDWIGSLSFFGAAYYSWCTCRQTKESAGYWLIVSIAMFFFFLWGVMISLQWLNIEPLIAVALQQWFLSSGAVALMLSSVLSFIYLTRPFD